MNDTKLQVLDERALDDLADRARNAPRRRQNLNLHPALSDPIQRLFNAGEPGTYVRPHRHRPGRWELVSVQRGQIDTLALRRRRQGDGALRLGGRQLHPKSPAPLWHSYVFVVPGTIALEIKPGPYDMALDKEFAAWAPMRAMRSHRLRKVDRRRQNRRC